MTKKSFKKFLLASSCAVTTLCSSTPLTYAMPPPSFVIFTSLGNIDASGTNLSNYSNQNPSPTFISGSAIQYSDDNIAINVDISTTTIQAIDVNGKSGTALHVNMSTTMPSPQLSLGSVYDRTAAPGAVGNQLVLNIADGNTVKLTGTNYTDTKSPSNDWVNSISNTNLTSPSTLIFTGAPNALYTYNSQMQSGYVQTDGSGLYSNNSLSGAPSTVLGPYNLYGLSTINLGDNATLLIESNIKGAPTILTNTFSFVNNSSAPSTNTRLLLSSPLTITSDTVGGFGNISSYLDTLFTLNVPDSSNGRVVTTFANTWTLPNTSTGHLSLNFLSDAVITNPTDLSSGVFGGGNIYIGSASQAANLTLAPDDKYTGNNVSIVTGIEDIALNNTDSSLTLDSTNYAAGFFSFQNANINVANISFAALSGPQDEDGKVTLKATNNQLQVYASNAGAQPLSADFGRRGYDYTDSNANRVAVFRARLQSLTITGDSAVTIDNVTSYTKELNLDSTGAIYLPKIFLGNDGTINVTQSNDINSVMNIEGTNTTITLGTHRLTASNNAPSGFYDIKTGGISSSIDHSNTYSTLALDGDVVINSSYDGTDSGQLVVDGFSNQAHKPSSLDMSASQTKLTIFFDTKGNVAQPNSSLTLLSATNDAEINMAEIVDFQPLNSNVTTTWSGAYDEDTKTYKISGTTVTPQAPPSTPGNVISVINFLTTPAVTTQNSDGTTTSSFSDAQLSALAATGSVATIADFIRNATALVVQAMRAADANKEASDESNRAVMNRASSLGGFSANDILTQADGLGTSAGDNEAKHGVWMNGFMEQSIQKKMDDNSGYKARGFGGTLGADTKITDEIVMGAAWTTANAIIKQKDDITGNKTTVATNIFSIYGLKILPNNWALEADVSGGVNNARNTSIRYNGDTPTFSKGKYKSHYFGGSINAIKRIKPCAQDIFIEPSVGLSYSQFNDLPYTENSGVINWSVAKRSSYNIEGLLGSKVIGLYDIGEWVVKPQAAAFAHITIKDKKGKVHTSLDNTPGAVQIDQTKASKAWYSGGAGLFVNKGAIEVGAAWEVQLDKKYVSNKGTIKLRVEF